REVAVRRAECALARGDLTQAAHEFEKVTSDDATDGRGALVEARLALSQRGTVADTDVALDLALRAFVLEAEGAGGLLATTVAASRDAVVVDRVRRVVAASGKLEEPTWAAAFAFAEGRRDDARKALARGLAKGDRRAAAALLALATETRDLDALHV